MSRYEQYLAMVAGCRALYPDQRAGQAHFNVLSEEYPDIADQMSTDPFYDDARLPAFLVQVESLMDTRAAR